MKRFFACLILISLQLSAHEVHIWDASDYPNHTESQKRTADYLISLFKFKGNEKILDLGSGDGKITAMLASLVDHGYVLGADSSKKMVQFACEKYEQASLPNLSFVQKNAYHLDYNQDFDVIFSFRALQWAKDHRAVLDGVYRALKPGGTFALSMPTNLPLSMQQVVDEMLAQHKWRPYFSNFETGFNFIFEDAYEQLLVDQGFDINLIETRFQKDIFQSKADLIQFISQWLPYLKPLPQHLKEKFASEFVDRYFILEGIEEGDEIYFNPPHLTVIAHKK